MKKEFIVNLKGCETKGQVLIKFYETFKFPDWDYPGGSYQDKNGNWDAFYDWFTSLDSDSEEIRNSPEKVTHVHLLLKNVLDFKWSDKEGFKILSEIMFRATDPTNPDSRYDDIHFSFTVEND